ncbi:hypothetical protein NDI56_04725 [Haloarcula sp. S1CR25-12]|uniref:DUF2254 domain-containing protein n=1 Tax=Haloarcula saliterrae TaxID=2950534 RepID=A0ABU2F8Z0_9EURY|nr:hypothetical protein [Haloarcula sp. S1CR25-12]MDS0258714.1 hypothetical protein [Haloarcula sp. S1CR25-12]
MSDFKRSVSPSTFLFGALPRQLLTAVVLEGITLIGFLQVTSTGFIDLDVTRNYIIGTATLGVVSVGLTIIYTYSIGRSSYSPALHKNRTLVIIAAGYTALGILMTAVAFLAHSVLLEQPPILNSEEIVFGLSIGSIFGFLILLYISRFGIDTPKNTEELQAAVSEVRQSQSALDSSIKAPIHLTKLYGSLGKSMEDVSNCLRQSSTDGGRELAQDIEEWVEVFSEKPEISQAVIVHRSRSPDGEELTELRNDFQSIIARLNKITKDE